MTFQDLPLKETLLKAIADRGYTEPTEIQAEAIPLLAGEPIDFVGQAQTGTGKTAAFVLPLLNHIDPAGKDVQALILTPTRELANQICEEIKKLTTYEKIKTVSVYGGVSIEGQIKDLRRGRPQIVVGTPGRVLDLIDRDILILDKAKFAVLDEADEMLDMGFIDDVQTILSNFSDERKTWMFSATMPGPILTLINKYLKDPKVIKIRKKTLSNESIVQKHFVVRSENMTEAVCRILDSLENYYGMIFCRTKVDAKSLADELNVRGYPSDSLHGDMSQQQRDITMKNFKNKKINMLVCTDVAARGIDVDNLTHVINYGLPQDIEAYVHRIGRTGRAGLTGTALTIIEPMERRKLGAIENITKAKIDKGTLPTADELKEVLVRKEIGKLDQWIEDSTSTNTEDAIYKIFAEKFETLSKEDFVKVVYTHLFKSQIDRYNKSPSLEIKERKPGERMERGARDGRGFDSQGSQGRANQNGNVRFFVNVGREHGIDLRGLLDSVASFANIDQRLIRNVDLKQSFSFLEVPEQYSEAILGIRGAAVGDRTVRFELTNGGPAPRRDFRGGGRGGDRGGNRDGGGFRERRSGGGNFRSERSSSFRGN